LIFNNLLLQEAQVTLSLTNPVENLLKVTLLKVEEDQKDGSKENDAQDKENKPKNTFYQTVQFFSFQQITTNGFQNQLDLRTAKVRQIGSVMQSLLSKFS
jgi:hypothetical protein